VIIDLLSIDVYPISKVKPASLNLLPAAFASSIPFSFSGTSIHPVNKFDLFHVDSP
jgi:hypothetical protein